eukprot:500399_1
MTDESKDESKNSGVNKEIITINIGGCGVALGQTLLEQYCAERGISTNGTVEEKSYKINKRPKDDIQADNSISIQFNETQKGKYKARSLFIDLDPYAINNINNIYSYKSLLNKSYLINGKHDSSSNFANAYHISGKQMIDSISNQLRNAVDACDNLQGFIINHSISGGTGAGLTSLIMEQIANDFKGKTVVSYSTMHDETFLSHPTQVYNAILMLDRIKDENICNYSVVLDNKQLYKIVQEQLQIKTPRFKHYNYMLNKLISSITAPVRYNINNCNLQTLQNELVPFKSLKYLTSSMWPIIPKIKTDNKKQIIYKDDIQSLVNQCTNYKNWAATASDFYPSEDKYMGIRFNFRGQIDKNKAMNAIEWIQKEKKVMFVDKVVKNVNIGTQFHDSIPNALANDDLIDITKQSVMIGNNTWISRLFRERISKIYDLLYSQRAYVHHYVGEGLEESSFAQGRETLGLLEKDYLESLMDAVDETEETEET